MTNDQPKKATKRGDNLASLSSLVSIWTRNVPSVKRRRHEHHFQIAQLRDHQKKWRASEQK